MRRVGKGGRRGRVWVTEMTVTIWPNPKLAFIYIKYQIIIE